MATGSSLRPARQHRPTMTLTPPSNTAAWPGRREISATVAWMDDEPLVVGRVYWALHGHRWVKAKVRRVVHCLVNIHTLAEEGAHQLEPNAIGHVELVLQEPCPWRRLSRRGYWAH